MEDELKKTVLDVCVAAEKLEIRVVLVGALVAQFSPEIGADYPKFHGTNDADFGVSVRDWDAYKKLYDELLVREFEPDPKIEHRLHRGEAMVDLIPYGSQIAPDGKLVWPKSGSEMTVTGFDEVCAAVHLVAESNTLPVPVITAAGFVLLKVISYLERQEQGHVKYRSDAKDIEYWLQNFASGTQDERRYSLVGQVGLEHQDYATAGAVLMGIEVGKLASLEAAVYVDRFLKESEDLYSPFMDALAAGQFEEAAEKRRKEGRELLIAFKKGYEHARRRSP
ncbi:MAG: hypothetical protein A2V88_07790 [Elusimicrobia bacterium RBG_16_66_12]|nr:MAG: hypothetical protein A2V88_07790 [Elusimicrobia bacterium RBG_16_66_12]